MLGLLRVLFAVVLASMLGVTSWATLQCPLFAVPRDVFTHPWFIATLADAYWGFITFFVWVAFKQTSWLARVAWFAAIMLLGNIAMSAYCLAELFAAAPGNRLEALLTFRRDGPGWLGWILAALGAIVVGVALP